jgi:hypothetical protein
MPDDPLITCGRYLDQFKIILLDMNSTFMFGEDRFHSREDFFSTYQRLGGARLDSTTVDTAIRNCYAGMSEDYEDPFSQDAGILPKRIVNLPRIPCFLTATR